MGRWKTAAWCSVAAVALLSAGCGSVSGNKAGGGTVRAPGTATASPTAGGPSASPGGSSSSPSGASRREFWPASLDMTSASTGWALYLSRSPFDTMSQPTLLARTVDGARGWTDVTPAAALPMLATASAAQALDPVNGERAYLAVSGNTRDEGTGANRTAVFGTADGGRTWTESAPFTADGPVVQVTFADARHGWLLVSVPEPSPAGKPLPWLYRTTDGGRHWSPAATAPPPGPVVMNNMCQLIGISFPTATTGWLHVSCRSGDYLARSTDGGSTWSMQSLPTASACANLDTRCDVFGPQVFGDTAFVTVAPEDQVPAPVLLVSQNLGRAWHRLPLPPAARTEQYPQLTFFGREDGVLVPAASQEALGKTFYTTADGGQTWAPVPQGTHFTQLGATIDFATPQAGFAWIIAGDSQGSTPPPMHATANSGRTWTPFTAELTG